MPQEGLAVKELRGFTGVNLRRDRVGLADEELAKAIGADLHSVVGVISTALGRKRLAGIPLPIPDSDIRYLRNVGTRYYRVAGRSVYLTTTAIINGELSQNGVTTIAAFRPLNETTNWAFIADDAVMKKNDGTNTYKWGIAPPTSRARGKRIEGTLNGVYSFRSTFARKVDGVLAHESNPSPVSRRWTLSQQAIISVNFETPTDPQVTHIRWYRTVAGGTDHFFESETSYAGDEYGYAFTWEKTLLHVPSSATSFKFTTAAENDAGRAYEAVLSWEVEHLDEPDSRIREDSVAVTTNRLVAIIFSVADSALGAILEIDNNVPPLASFTMAHQDHMFLGRDATAPHRLWWSKRFRPEAVPLENFIEIADPTDPIQGLATYAGLLGVFTRLTKFRVVGSGTSGFIAQEALSRRGTPCPCSVLSTEFGVVFVARDGAFLTNLVQEDSQLAHDILPIFAGETVNDYLPINWEQGHKIVTAAYRRRLYMAYPTDPAANSDPDMIAVYSIDTQKWFFYRYPVRSLNVEEDLNRLVAGANDGHVYVLEEGFDNVGLPVSLDVETRDLPGDTPHHRKLYRYFRVDADITDGDSVSVGFMVDGTLKATRSLTGSRTRQLLSLPEGCLGQTCRFRVSYSGKHRPSVYGFEALYLPLEAA